MISISLTFHLFSTFSYEELKKKLHKPGDSILENKRRNNRRRGEEDGQGGVATLSIHSTKGKCRDPVIRDKAAKRCWLMARKPSGLENPV